MSRRDRMVPRRAGEHPDCVPDGRTAVRLPFVSTPISCDEFAPNPELDQLLAQDSAEPLEVVAVDVEAIEPVTIGVLKLDTSDFYPVITIDLSHSISGYAWPHATTDAGAREDAIEYLRRLRDRIDLTLRAIDQGPNDQRPEVGR